MKTYTNIKVSKGYVDNLAHTTKTYIVNEHITLRRIGHMVNMSISYSDLSVGQQVSVGTIAKWKPQTRLFFTISNVVLNFGANGVINTDGSILLSNVGGANNDVSGVISFLTNDLSD